MYDKLDYRNGQTMMLITPRSTMSPSNSSYAVKILSDDPLA